MSSLGNSASYQISGIPFVYTATETKTITFKYVTKAITVQSTGAGNTINFNDSGTTNITLAQNKVYRFDIKCTGANITIAAGNVSIVAELTGIKAGFMSVIDQDNYIIALEASASENSENVIHLPLDTDSAQSGIAAVTITETGAGVTYASGEGHFANTGAVLFDEDSSSERITITPDDTSACANNPLCWDGEFTFDFWIRFDNTVTNNNDIGYMYRYGTGVTAERLYIQVYNNRSTGGTDHSMIRIRTYETGSSLNLYVVDNGTNTDGPGLSDNNWHHVAMTRDSNWEIRVFVDGVKKDLLNAESGGSVVTLTHQGTIDPGNYMYMYSLPQDTYLSNFRMVKGCAVWTANFTPPTSPGDGTLPSGC